MFGVKLNIILSSEVPGVDDSSKKLLCRAHRASGSFVKDDVLQHREGSHGARNRTRVSISLSFYFFSASSSSCWMSVSSDRARSSCGGGRKTKK